MKKLITLLLVAIAINKNAVAQMQCGTDLVTQELIAKDPNYALHNQKANSDWAAYQNMLRAAKVIVTGKDTTYQIPVVFHIIHSGEPIGTLYNPSAAAIDSLIDYLNKAWNATWPYYPDTNSGGVRIPIQFVLAKRDPTCGPTTGINRIDGRILAHYDSTGVIYSSTTLSGPNDSAVKSLSIWPNCDYYNIWIVKYIDGPTGFYAGYAFFPSPYIFDGTILAAKYAYPLSTRTDYWYTIPHELGHAFNLYHTFQGSSGIGSCPPNGSCATDGDGICDTEPHEYINGVCMSGLNSCTGVSYAGVQYNIMNYSTCFNRFTKNQKERIIFSLKSYRMGLVNSLGGTLPDPTFVAPVATCIPGIKNPNNKTDIGPHNVSIGDMITSSNGYTADGNKAYLDRTCIQGAAHLSKGKTYSLSVTSGITAEKVRAWIDYNNDGTFQPGELVLSHNGTTYYEVHTSSVTIPASATLGTTLRMRVMSDMSTSPDPSPCTDVEYGQTEDYSVIIDNPTSIENISSSNELTIFPNPASDILNIQCSNAVDITIYSIESRLLLQQKNTKSIAINNLSDGLYIVKLTDALDGHFIKNVKFIKQLK